MCIFAPDKVGGQTTGQFVSLPFNSWVVQSQKMLAHAKLGCYLTAMARMHEYTQPAAAIDVQCNQKLQLNVERS